MPGRRRAPWTGGAPHASRYLHKMTRVRTIATLCVACLLATAGFASAVLAPFAPAAAAPRRALAQSPQLWATVDVCDAPRHPATIGIRGSMPTDGHPRDTMYMRFLVQSQDPTTHTWANLGKGADSGFVAVGVGNTVRQAGRTFEFAPTATPYTLRGEVEFQWRRSGRAVHLATRYTTAGHRSVAGAEPPGYSAATCTLK